MKTRMLIVAITFIAVFAMAARISLDTDTWWHLRAGTWMLDHQTILRQDIFSHTKFNSSWEYPGWLVQILMAWIYNNAGPGGLNLWTAFMVMLAYICIWKVLNAGPFTRAFLIIISAAVSGVYWSARPHLMTLVLTAVFIWFLDSYHHARKTSYQHRLWLLPLFMALWVNSHGGFVVGFLVWGVYWLACLIQTIWIPAEGNKLNWNWDFGGRRLGPFISLTLIGIFLIIAAGLNPFGYKMLNYPFLTIGITSLQDYIQEWQSPNFHSLQVQPFALLLLACLGVLGISRKRVNFPDISLTAGFAYMGLMAGRNIALFGLAAPLLLARHITPLLNAVEKKYGIRLNTDSPVNPQRSIINWFILVIILLAAGIKSFSIFPENVNEAAFSKSLPLGAINYLHNTKPTGKLFNSYNWGGYLIWALPEYPVFIDGRTDLYDDEFIGKWLQAVTVDKEWSHILEQYGANIILIESDSTLDKVLKTTPEWTQSYRDDLSVIYIK